MKKDKGRWLYSHSFLYLNVIIKMGKGYLEMAIYGIKRFNKKSRERLGELKFIRLVNEYLWDKQNWLYCRREIEDGIYDSFFHTEDWEGIIEEAQIISKSFGFIKWLVDKDKIDIEKVIDTAKSSVIDTYYYEEGIDDIYIPLLMILSIQDDTINFLISILK